MIAMFAAALAAAIQLQSCELQRLKAECATIRVPENRAQKDGRTAKRPAAKSASPVRHTVKRGETLYSIANNYNTSVTAIKQTNAHLATLRPGMVLVIPAQQ